MHPSEARLDVPTHINGLDTTALGAAVAGVAADPSLAPLTFRARTAWQGGFKTRTEVSSYDLGGQTHVRRHVIHSDEPLELLGENSAPNPQDLLLSAVAACMSVGFVVGCTAAGITVHSLEIDTECTLDLRGAFGVDPNIAPGAPHVKYTLRVRGDGTREQFEQIHQEMTTKSPNYYHLTRAIPMISQVVIG